jgi:predicted nucleic acid-binding protein
MIFCDASAVAKLYVPEREAAAARRLLETEDDVCVSEFARIELMGVWRPSCCTMKPIRLHS